MIIRRPLHFIPSILYLRSQRIYFETDRWFKVVANAYGIAEREKPAWTKREIFNRKYDVVHDVF